MLKSTALACLLMVATASPSLHAGTGDGVSNLASRFDTRFRELDLQVNLVGPEEAKRVLAEMKGLVPAGDARRERLYRTLVCGYGFDKNPKGGHAYALAQVQEAERAGDAEAKARFRLCQAGYTGAIDSHHKTLAVYEAAIADARQANNSLLVAFGIQSRGSMHSIIGNQAAALLDFLDAQRMLERLKLTDWAEDNLFNIAVSYRRMGEFDKAADYLRQYEATARKRKDDYILTSVLLQKGYLDEEQGNLAAAETHFEDALELGRRLDSRYDVGIARVALASLSVATGQPERALGLLRKAEADFRETGDDSNGELIALYRGQALSKLGRHREALASLDTSEQLMKGSGNLRYQALLYRARSDAYAALGEFQPALDDLRAHLSTQKQLDEKARGEQTQLLRHQFDAQRRDLENARLTAEKALREQEISALTQARNWQWAALLLGGVLMVIVAATAIRQVLRARRLQVLALTDALTGVANRRRIERIATEQIAEALAQRKPFSVLTLDVDYFKRINDTHGHLAGDQVLIHVAEVCQNALREFDVIGRTGGEEFLVVLPRAQLAAAAQVAERLRSSVEELVLEEVAPGLKVSISLGVAEFRAEDRDLKELMRRADNALYRAKANGRNRVEIEP